MTRRHQDRHRVMRRAVHQEVAHRHQQALRRHSDGLDRLLQDMEAASDPLSEMEDDRWLVVRAPSGGDDVVEHL